MYLRAMVKSELCTLRNISMNKTMNNMIWKIGHFQFTQES